MSNSSPSYTPHAFKNAFFACLLCALSGPLVLILLVRGDFGLAGLVLIVGFMIAFVVSLIHTFMFTVPLWLLLHNTFQQYSFHRIWLTMMPIHVLSVLLPIYWVEDSWFDHRDGYFMITSILANAELVLFVFCQLMMRRMRKIKVVEIMPDQIGTDENP